MSKNDWKLIIGGGGWNKDVLGGKKIEKLTIRVCGGYDYSRLESNKHAPKKTKLFCGNQKPHVTKVLRTAIMKRLWLKNKTNKTRKAVDIFNYKRQRNLVVKINNKCKREYFDKLNVKTTTKPFWKTCKPYFSNKHSHGGSKITLIENDRIVSENNKIAKTFNTHFESQIHWIFLIGFLNLLIVTIKFNKL